MVLDEFVGVPMPAFEFARRAFERVGALTNAEFFDRPGPLQQLIEEVLPLATFAKTWERVEQRVTVEYHGPNTPCDAVFSLSGEFVDSGGAERYFVEVTSALNEGEYLERELLRTTGSAFPSPSTRREGSRRRGTRRIINEPTLRGDEAHVKELIELFERALREKDTGSYPEPCILLIRSDPSRPLNLREWSEVFTSIAPTLAKSQFVAIAADDAFAGTTRELRRPRA